MQSKIIKKYISTYISNTNLKYNVEFHHIRRNVLSPYRKKKNNRD